MARKWYGSVINRLEENRRFCEEITVGTGMTEYHWSDRTAYEVVEVIDQKHVYVREYDVKHIGEPMTNNWQLISNENNPARLITKRGKYWYWTSVFTPEILDVVDEDAPYRIPLLLVHNNITEEELREKGKITRYYRANVSFGRADYYYDYEF